MGFASAKNKFSAFGSHHHCTRFQKAGAFSSAGLEHLPYKQRVGGSNPSTPTKEFQRNTLELFFLCKNENFSFFDLGQSDQRSSPHFSFLIFLCNFDLRS